MNSDDPWYVGVDEAYVQRCRVLAADVWPDKADDARCESEDDEDDSPPFGIQVVFIFNQPGYVNLDIGGDTVMQEVPLARLEIALVVLAGQDRYQSTIDYATAMLQRAQMTEAQLERVREWRAAVHYLPRHHEQEIDAILDGNDGIDRLIARSSLGEAARRMQTNPDAELQRIDYELTPEVMDAIRDCNAMPPAWVEALASDWESSYRMLRENYPEHAGLTLIANCLRDLAAELRKRAKEG